MPERDLVDAYLDGRISRRTLIRRLVAGGISVGAAVSYAHLLRPEAASAASRRGAPEPFYPELTIEIKSNDLRKVLQKEKVAVIVRTDETTQTSIVISRRIGQSTSYAQIGQEDYNPLGAGREKIAVEVDTTDLKGKDKANLRATIDGVGLHHGHAEDVKTIKKS